MSSFFPFSGFLGHGPRAASPWYGDADPAGTACPGGRRRRRGPPAPSPAIRWKAAHFRRNPAAALRVGGDPAVSGLW